MSDYPTAGLANRGQPATAPSAQQAGSPLEQRLGDRCVCRRLRPIRSRPKLGRDTNELDHPPHAGADLAIDHQLPAPASSIRNGTQHRQQAATIDEAKLREIKPHTAACALELPKACAQLIGHRQIQLTKQPQMHNPVHATALARLKRRPLSRHGHIPTSYAALEPHRPDLPGARRLTMERRPRQQLAQTDVRRGRRGGRRAGKPPV
jgi:hypothetical protein